MPLPDHPLPIRITGRFLFLSYFICGPGFAIADFYTGIFSERFGYPSVFIYLIGLTQFACSIALFSRRTAAWSLAVLTVICIGAIASHLMINSPLTALPALGYACLQIWYWYHIRHNSDEKQRS